MNRLLTIVPFIALIALAPTPAEALKPSEGGIESIEFSKPILSCDGKARKAVKNGPADSNLVITEEVSGIDYVETKTLKIKGTPDQIKQFLELQARVEIATAPHTEQTTQVSEVMGSIDSLVDNITNGWLTFPLMAFLLMSGLAKILRATRGKR